MSTINELAERYYNLNELKSSTEKELKPINKEIKDLMESINLEKMETTNGFKIEIGTQNRSKVNEDKLVQLLKMKGFTDAIKTVEVPDEQIVERLVYTGELTADEYSTCIDKQIVKTLKIKKK